MVSFNERMCKQCGAGYVPTGPAQKYCPICAEMLTRESRRQRAYDAAVRSGRIKNPGVGSGGNQRGEKNPYWKGGISHSVYRLHLKGACERCGKSSGRLLTHHKDGNHSNNDPSNWETLCYRCHLGGHGAFERLAELQQQRKKARLAIVYNYLNSDEHTYFITLNRLAKLHDTTEKGAYEWAERKVKEGGLRKLKLIKSGRRRRYGYALTARTARLAGLTEAA